MGQLSRFKTVILCAGLVAVVSSSYATAKEKKISISVQSTAMRDVLKFIAEQSETSIVISPEVSDQMMDVTVRDIPLEEALDVILKPYGCGYSKIGQTVVVDRLDNLSRLGTVEPLVSRVYKLKYLDAKGVMSIVKGLLSERGRVEVLTNVQQLGWQFAASQDSQAAKAERVKKDKKAEEAASRTVVVTDTPSVLTRIQEVVDEIDVRPRQIEIKSHFIEFSEDYLRDIGLQWGIRKNSGEFQTGQVTPSTILNTVLGTTLPGIPVGADIDGGLQAGIVRDGDTSIGLLMNMAAQDEGVNVLSAPRILAQENQEAAIIVGKKVPIITTEAQGTSGAVSTKVDYYERIGIQLNVIPQICEDQSISMVVHPSVTEQDGVASARITSFSGESTPLTEYPIIRTREAETRLIVESGQTVAIGGLVLDRQTKGVEKVPFLGDIPYLGRLFRRDISGSEQIELVILIKATLEDEMMNCTDVFDKRIDQADNKLINFWSSKINTEDETNAKEDPAMDSLLDEMQ